MSRNKQTYVNLERVERNQNNVGVQSSQSGIV